MKYLKITPSIKIHLSGIFCFLIFNLYAQDYEGLIPLEKHETQTYYSSGAQVQAEEMALRCNNVRNFYKELFHFNPEITLLVLSEKDWSRFTSFPVYGMPHYKDDKTLIVAADDNEFWKSFIPPLENLSPVLRDKIVSVYSDKNHNLTMRSFFDLLAIHELGHAYHMQGGLNMQRRWMGELFSNIFLHTYIAEMEPELLPALTTFPEMVVSSTDPATLTYTSLTDLEANYEKIAQQFPQNYGWFQCRWHKAAGEIYEEGKTAVMRRLWQMLKAEEKPLNDEMLIKELDEKVHASVADVPLKWDAL